MPFPFTACPRSLSREHAEQTPCIWRRHFADRLMRSDLGTGRIGQVARSSPDVPQRRRRTTGTSIPSNSATSPNRDSGAAGPDQVSPANRPCSDRLLRTRNPPLSEAGTFTMIRRLLMNTCQVPEVGSRPSRLRTEAESPYCEIRMSGGVVASRKPPVGRPPVITGASGA